jgi:two-component system CheB/CheR fusion protein
MHGGTVSAHSEGEGRGTEFVVRLPIAERPDRVEAPDETGAPAAGPPPRASRILVVEDNADSRDMLCVLLVSAGFECETASNGLDALERLETLRPDVVILDVGLPGIDGFEVARRIRAHPSLGGVRLVAVTGYGQDADRAATRKAGFDAHLVKPVQADLLLGLLGADPAADRSAIDRNPSVA